MMSVGCNLDFNILGLKEMVYSRVVTLQQILIGLELFFSETVGFFNTLPPVYCTVSYHLYTNDKVI